MRPTEGNLFFVKPHFTFINTFIAILLPPADVQKNHLNIMTQLKEQPAHPG